MLMSRVIRDKVQTLAIAEALRLDPDMVVGKLHAVWAWADQQADDCQLVDGVLRPGSAAMVDAKANRKGFAQAMVAVGWLEIGEGFVRFPNAGKWMGKEAKKRAANAARMKQARDSEDARDTHKSRTKNAQERHQRREEERRGEVNTPKPPAGAVIEIPASLQTPEFAAAWERWGQHRREIKKPLTPTSSDRQLASLASMGPARAVAAIDHTIEKGWQGIREPDVGRQPGLYPPSGQRIAPGVHD